MTLSTAHLVNSDVMGSQKWSSCIRRIMRPFIIAVSGGGATPVYALVRHGKDTRVSRRRKTLWFDLMQVQGVSSETMKRLIHIFDIPTSKILHCIRKSGSSLLLWQGDMIFNILFINKALLEICLMSLFMSQWTSRRQRHKSVYRMCGYWGCIHGPLLHVTGNLLIFLFDCPTRNYAVLKLQWHTWFQSILLIMNRLIWCFQRISKFLNHHSL